MGSIARLPVTAWLPVLVAAVGPVCTMAARPDSPPAGRALAAPAARTAVTVSAPADARSIRIPYLDLDLATPQGIALLYLRIRRAAAELCDASRPVTGTRMIRPEAEACVRRSVGATVRQTGVQGLAALDAEQQVLGEETAAPRPMCDAPVRAKVII
jgi:UrcA family protein